MTTTQQIIKRRPRLVAIVLSIVLGASGIAVPAASLAQPSAHAASKHHVRHHRHRRHRHHGRGIPQHNGGDADSDNNGGPSDGDGGI
jgi:Ni/Co efflux regulator RcnB